MSIKQIHGVLESAVTSALGSTAVERENIPLNPPAGTKWAQVYFLPNQPEVDTIGPAGKNHVDGIYQVNLNYPVGTGDDVVRDDFEAIYSAFPAKARTAVGGQQVTINGCGRSQGRNVGNWYRVSVTIEWEAQISR